MLLLLFVVVVVVFFSAGEKLIRKCKLNVCETMFVYIDKINHVILKRNLIICGPFQNGNIRQKYFEWCATIFAALFFLSLTNFRDRKKWRWKKKETKTKKKNKDNFLISKSFSRFDLSQTLRYISNQSNDWNVAFYFEIFILDIFFVVRSATLATAALRRQHQYHWNMTQKFTLQVFKYMHTHTHGKWLVY